MADSQKVTVNEVRREIAFDDGTRLNLHNVYAFDPSGTWLRMWSEEGFTLINPSRVTWMTAKSTSKIDEQ